MSGAELKFVVRRHNLESCHFTEQIWMIQNQWQFKTHSTELSFLNNVVEN